MSRIVILILLHHRPKPIDLLISLIFLSAEFPVCLPALVCRSERTSYEGGTELWLDPVLSPSLGYGAEIKQTDEMRD
jgi:hypothetical protein